VIEPLELTFSGAVEASPPGGAAGHSAIASAED
jgi:hypothetical protein